MGIWNTLKGNPFFVMIGTLILVAVAFVVFSEEPEFIGCPEPISREFEIVLSQELYFDQQGGYVISEFCIHELRTLTSIKDDGVFCGIKNYLGEATYWSQGYGQLGYKFGCNCIIWEDLGTSKYYTCRRQMDDAIGVYSG